MQVVNATLEVDIAQYADLCAWLEKAGLIGQLRDSTGGIQGLGKVDKVYLDNPTLIYVCYVVKDDIEIGYGNIIPLWQFGLTY